MHSKTSSTPVKPTYQEVSLRKLNLLTISRGSLHNMYVLSIAFERLDANGSTKSHGEKLIGPVSDGLARDAVFKDEELTWSPCEEQGMLNINFSVALVSSTSASAEETEDIERLVASDATVTVYGFGGNLVWRPSKC